MTEGSGRRVALGVAAGLGLGAVGVLVLPAWLVPSAPEPETGTELAAVEAVPQPPAPAAPAEAPAEAPPAAAPSDSAPAAPVAAPADEAEPAEAAPPEADAGTDAPEPDADAAAATPASDPLAPAFDTVRLAADGAGLVAGRAAPGSTVAVLVDGAPATEAVADADGAFVAFLDLPADDAPRAVSLRDAEGRESPETVILAPTAAPLVAAETAEAPAAATAPDATAPDANAPDAIAAAAPATEAPAEGSAASPLGGEADAGSPAAAASAVASATAAAEPGGGDPTATVAAADPAVPGPAAPAADAPAAPAPSLVAEAPDLAAPGTEAPAQPPVLVSDAAGVRVLQPALAPGAGADVIATVALDAVAYDAAGEPQLSGRARGGTVRLYLDNALVGEAAVGADGTWAAPLPEAEPGRVHALRLDQVDAGGAVESRIETPFRREPREALAAAVEQAAPGAAGGAPRGLVRVVQPGNTLWAIARDRYDEPLMYVRVFEANRDRIRDPDLIYPGQIFVLPDAE